MNPERFAALRSVGPFAGLQVVPSLTDEERLDLVSNPVDPSAPIGPLSYHGGPTLAAPKLVALYAGSFYGDRAKNDQFLKEVMTYGYLSGLSGLSGQGSGSGQFLGSFDLPAPVVHVTDADCQAMIRTAIAQNPAIPRPDAQTIYMLILADGIAVGDGTPGDSSCTAYCGYHNAAADFLYTVQPATTCAGCNQGQVQDALQMVEAHEIAESCSDPHGTGWYNDATGQENADECAWVQQSFGPWVVQGYAAENGQGQWVNTVGAYVVPQPPPQPFKPDANLLAWLAREVQVAQMAHDAYSTGDFATAFAAQDDLDRYGPWLRQYLTDVQRAPQRAEPAALPQPSTQSA